MGADHMKVDEAWDRFTKTGSIQEYMEYKNLCREQEKGADFDRRNSNKNNKYR